MTIADTQHTAQHRHSGAMLQSFLCPYCDERIGKTEMAWVALPITPLRTGSRTVMAVCPACERSLGVLTGQ